ncbi:MAG: patatin-like phospholipase family protein [Erysipelotrichaceae bacterium]|nr:patatin-like phospholipase family protein [Erysipelotrichaceae bacterium]
MKRGLVLAGGGSKGAYEVGFVKALHELDIEYHIVTGTSIGALNGCLLAQQDVAAMENLWQQLDITQVFTNGFYPRFSNDIDDMLDQSNLAVSFFKSFIKEKGADITPLKELIRSLLNEEKLLTSPIDFGLCTVNYPKLKPVMITKKEMKKEYIFDYLIASASCFPVFPIHTFDNQSYIDGGYYDNVPIDLAFDMGADEVLVVDMHMEATHPYYINRPRVIYTTPYVNLGTFMDFNKNSIERNQRIGYQTAMKYFGNLVGVVYTFEPFDTPLFHEFYSQILYLERKIRLYSRNDNFSINHYYLESHKNQPLNEEDYVYITLDWLGELLEIDPTYIYEIDDFIDNIFNEFEKYIDKDYHIIPFESSGNLFDDFATINRKGIVGRLLHMTLYPQSFKWDILKFMNLFSKETLMSRLLYLLYYEKGALK